MEKYTDSTELHRDGDKYKEMRKMEEGPRGKLEKEDVFTVCPSRARCWIEKHISYARIL